MTKILKDKKITILLIILGIFLLLLINKYWISPDEFFYVSLGRSIAASYNGYGCLECIDIAHTPLLPFLISLGYFFLKQDSVIFYRTISIAFTLGTIYLLYQTLKEVIKNSEVAFFALFSIFLFPGFFTFVEKVNLDILSLFFSTLVLLLLLRKEKYWKVSIALIFVFLSKEYTVFFPGIVVSAMIFVDVFMSRNCSIASKIKTILVNHLIVFLPILIVTFSLVIVSILPYPRMLDNLIIEIVGDNYLYYGQKLRELLYNQINDKLFILNDNSFKSFINRNVIDFIIKDNVFYKIKQIYLSSFQEADINIVVIPLVITGLFVRIKIITNSFKKNYRQIRQDIIYLLFFLVVLCFNFRIASGQHGFRIIFPVIIPSTYFIYYACLSIFKKKNYSSKLIFSLLFLFIGYIYFQMSDDLVGCRSLLLKYPVTCWFFLHKKYLNLLLYSTIALYILMINKIHYRHRYHLMGLMIILTCAYKVLPFAIDKVLSDKQYGQEYNLKLASPYLEQVNKQNATVLSNTREFQFYYYAKSIHFPNIDKPILPVARKLPREIYPNRFIFIDSNDDIFNLQYLCQNKIDYIFYLNKDSEEISISKKIQESPLLTVTKEYYFPSNNRYNWGLYRFDNIYCTKKEKIL